MPGMPRDVFTCVVTLAIHGASCHATTDVRCVGLTCYYEW